MNIKIIGLGGIGSTLSLFLSRYVNYEKFDTKNITLIDGKRFEERKAERQEFSSLGNKALIKMSELKQRFFNIVYEAIPVFVTEDNISRIIEEGDVVFVGVDNHKTRKLISDYCGKLNDIILLSLIHI